MRTLIIVAICVASAVGVDGQPSPARSPTSTSCAAAKNLSVVQAWSTDIINVKENVPRQECHFTVNGSPGQAGMGASASGPNPATAIFQPGWTAGGPVPIEELARLLDGSSTKPEPGLTSNLDKYAEPGPGLFRGENQRQDVPVRFRAGRLRRINGAVR